MSHLQFANAVGVTRGAVQQWESGATAPSRKTQKKVAEFMGISVGTLMEDTFPGLPAIESTSPVPKAKRIEGDVKKANENVGKSEGCLIPQFHTGGSMGHGLLLRDQPGIINSWNVSKEWIQKNVPSNTGTANLCIVTGFGPSIRPLFNPGDPLLIDRGITSYRGDAIYFFRVGEEGFIKSLQSIPGVGLRVISANTALFDTWTITPDMDFEVFGRVLKVWKSEEF